MPEKCPDCGIEMKEEHFKEPFGNPIEIENGIPTEVCPKCGFRIISEENLGIVKRAIRNGEAKLKC
jgi:DNA-directed RNA polymerase subunit RPC12/RpoP